MLWNFEATDQADQWPGDNLHEYVLDDDDDNHDHDDDDDDDNDHDHDDILKQLTKLSAQS